MLSRLGLKYPSKLHCEKVASHLSSHYKHNCIILAKGTEVKNRDNTDTEIEFRQESNFLYLTGVQEDDFYFVYDLHSKRSYLIPPDHDPVNAIWKGPILTDKELLKKYDVDHIVRYSDLLHLLKHKIKPEKILGWNQPEKVRQIGKPALEHELEHYISHRLVHFKRFEGDCSPSPSGNDKSRYCHHRSAHDHGPYGDRNGHRGYSATQDNPFECPDEEEDRVNNVTLLEALVLARINKTPIEIALSREATRITSDAHRLVLQSVRPGMYEYQLEALFRYECARQGAKAQAYLPIVGTGVNPAYLHYTRNDQQIQNGDMILVDAACEADCYGSDVTRTFPANGKFTTEQAAIYNLVLEMQNSVINKMKKGVDWREMKTMAQRIGLRGLKDLGILRGEDNDLIESDVILVFFPHGLGHLLGLNVHDDGLGLSIQLPRKKAIAAFEKKTISSVQFHSMEEQSNSEAPALTTLPPPSARRNKLNGSSLYATPSTLLEPGMLVTVEPGIYFNPAQIEAALKSSVLGDYFDVPTLRRYMSVGGVRIEDVILILADGSAENITTAPKDPMEIERIIQEAQQERQQSHIPLADDRCLPKADTKELRTAKETCTIDSEEQRGLKKRVGVFKRLLKAIRRLF
ncbi:hypothetical protein BGW38_003323 [Lunasporangiospora selenospora]|uniref:Aminopeptidase P N-terminal domain-containing protein n=1 Tax=Lunasporangiospora selenospora TaxID=979761 RepID=A0A9P6KCY1_9FUNG|nr:hypothetical protein BGW38_003323 [Lunasporangiospora selenospora]